MPKLVLPVLSIVSTGSCWSGELIYSRMRMTKPFLILLIIAAFACRQKKTVNAGYAKSDTSIIAGKSESPNALNIYKQFVSELDSSVVETATQAAEKYQELFANQGELLRDSGFVVFNVYYERLDRNINELHQKDTTNFNPLIMTGTPEKSSHVPEKLKQYNDRLKSNGFEISSSEGISYIKQDRNFISKWFYGYVSSAMKEYLTQLNKENKEGFLEDAGLVIDARQFVNRLIWWENFIRKNPKFLLIDESKESRKYLLTFFLTGSDNSPVLSYQTNKLNDYYKQAYAYLQSNFAHSGTNKLVSPYFEAFSKDDKQKAMSILEGYKRRGVIIDFSKL